MSTPTITDPASSVTNDPSVVVANDNANAAAATDLDISTNVVQYNGYRVYTGCGLLIDTVNPANKPSHPKAELYPRTVNNFIAFYDEALGTGSSVKFVDMSLYALPYPHLGTGAGTNLKVEQGTQPATVSATLKRAVAPSDVYTSPTWTDVGSALTVSAPNLETIATLDLSGQTYDATKKYYRVYLEASSGGYGGTSDWSNPVFVCVTVRFKDSSH